MATTMSPQEVTRYVFLLGGVTAIVFGVILLFRQDEALSILMVMLGLWWLIQGAFLVFAVFINREDMGWKLVVGLLGVLAGVVVLFNPGEAADVFRGTIGVVLGILGILVGLASLVGGARAGQMPAMIFGVFSVVIGILILTHASFSTSLLVTIFAIALLVEGVSSTVVALRG